jgi:two-component system, OmpR family, alkaline phosphatase synthesis response regulator PhoP
MVKEKILVIEDEDDIQELIRYNLAKEGFQVIGANTGEDGLRIAKTSQPDLILLDIMLPGKDGLEICRLLSADPLTQHVPVIMVTAKGEETDVVTGLRMGADDYITKPFSPKILVARVKTVLRRKKREAAPEDNPIKVGELFLHPGRHEVTLKGKPVRLTYTEFALLKFLAQRPGWVFSRQQIVDAVKGSDYAVTDRAVDVQVVGLRKKLGPYGEWIETVRGAGYRFKE